MRFPAPLRPGDRIGVTAPSAGVADRFRPRFDVAVSHLGACGYDVVLGECLDGSGPVSAPAPRRAAELTAMLTDPSIRAVVPPWGGEMAIDLLPHLDWEAIEGAEPTWLVGYSDVSTLLLPLTLRGIATVHGPNLMDTPYAVPAPLMPWLDVVTAPRGAVLTQGPSRLHQRAGRDDWEVHPDVTDLTVDTPGRWRRLDADDPVEVSGRLIGGCVETLTHLTGTPFGDVPGFGTAQATDGLLVYLEVAESGAFDVGRALHGMRLAGWFDHASAVLLGRTGAPDAPGFSQDDAVLDALGPLGVPLLGDLDIGHVPPQMTLVNGALTTLGWSPGRAVLTQTLA